MDLSKDTYNPKEAEPRIQKFWEDEKIYTFDRKSKKPVYSIDTPPPYISGRPHMGHAYSYSLFDAIGRFKRMNGFNVLLPIGFDDNGHPTERYVEKKYNIRSADLPREKFIELCKKETEILKKIAKADLVRLGLGFDWSLFYSTIGDLATKTAQYSFIDLYNKKLVYRKEEPTLWCTYCKTALAQADVEDVKRNTTLNYIKFKLEDGGDITIATTRPEFLPACVGIFVNPEDKKYKQLIGKTAIVPIFGQKVKIMADKKVDPEFGTGIVMICTFGDKTDIEWWKQYNLPLKIIITEEGKLNEIAGKYKGLSLSEGREKIISELREKKLLEKQEKIEQIVGACWRCEHPIEFLITKQWTLKLLENKDKFLEFGRKVKWHPNFFLKRYEDWVNNLKWDWVIARQRHYGVPIPVWYCKKCKKEIIASEKEIPINPLKNKPIKKCSCGSNEFEPETNVFDTWFTSSLTPEIVLRWVDNNKFFKKNFPEDLRPQGYEIIRTWAFYTIVKAFYHFKSIPWKNIMINGMVVDPQGRAMHKSLGNVIEPFNVLENYCADAMRFWSFSGKIGGDLPFQEKELIAGKKTITKLWNAAKFSMSNASPKKPKKLKAFDEWLLIKLNKLIKECTKSFNEYDAAKVKAEVENFFWHTFCDNYLEIIKDRIYNNKEGKDSAQYTLYISFLSIIKMFAPIMPHITEELYQLYFRKNEKIKSIHISKWPEAGKEKDERIEKAGDRAIEIIKEIRMFKSKAKKSMKTPIILTIEEKDKKLLEPFIDDLKSVASAEKIEIGKFGIKLVE
ncbi:MAG: valine--tRNA ligase [Candidatus Pacearchaeota archaeon]